jgi:hypothetical protein
MRVMNWGVGAGSGGWHVKCVNVDADKGEVTWILIMCDVTFSYLIDNKL